MAGKQAILVEGETADRSVMLRFLERAGFKTTAFASLEAAKQWVARQPAPPRLAVVGLPHPGAGGVDFAFWLLGLNPGLRTLFTAGRGAGDVRTSGLPAGSFELLYRPFLDDDFQGAVASLMLRPARQDHAHAKPE